jgi:hypothetical protein
VAVCSFSEWPKMNFTVIINIIIIITLQSYILQMRLQSEILLLLMLLFILPLCHFLGYCSLYTEEMRRKVTKLFWYVFAKLYFLHSLRCVITGSFNPNSTPQFSVNFLRPNNKNWHRSWERTFTFLLSVWKCLLVYWYVIFDSFYNEIIY